MCIYKMNVEKLNEYLDGLNQIDKFVEDTSYYFQVKINTNKINKKHF